MSRRQLLPKAAVFLVVVPLVLVAAGCGGSKKAASTTTTTSTATTQAVNTSVSGSVSFDGVWTGAEATAFGGVIKAFNKVYPNVKVTYHPVGDNLPTVVSTAVAGGNPPDMADIAQPGLVAQFVAKGALKPITYAHSVLVANFSPSWIALGT